MIVEIVLALSCVLMYLFWRDNYANANRPPGPLKLPIIGNLHQVAATGYKLPFEAFDALSRRYGPIMSLKLGMSDSIVLSDYEDMTALLTRDECDGRVLQELIADRTNLLPGKPLGVIFSNEEEWKQVRRFTIRSLRDFGFGKKNSLETVVGEELNRFKHKIEEDASKNGGMVQVFLFFNLSLLNILWSMVSGETFSYDDKRLTHLLQLVEKGFKSGNFASDAGLAFPFLRFIPHATGRQIFLELFKQLHSFFYEIIYTHRARPEHAPENFVDLFLEKIHADSSNGKKSPYFTDEQLNIVLMDLFMTGAETLGGSLSFAMLFMILHPEVQKKVQKEIDEVVPRGQDVRFEDRKRMTYTQATILEILRLGDIVPIIPPRKVLKEFSYKGYTFPKNMTIMPNLYSVFSSEKYWDKPNEFNPERFIDSKGQLINTEKMQAFGFGKRYCMGETQATPVLFLYFTNLLQHFEFSQVPTKPPPTTRPVAAFTLTPQPFDMVVKIRG